MDDTPLYERVSARSATVAITCDVFTDDLTCRIAVTTEGRHWRAPFCADDARDIAQAMCKTYKPVGTLIELERAEIEVIDDPNGTPAPYVRLFLDLDCYTHAHLGRGLEVMVPAIVAQYLGLRLRETYYRLGN